MFFHIVDRKNRLGLGSWKCAAELLDAMLEIDIWVREIGLNTG